MPQTEPSRDLLAQLSNGDHAALETLLERHLPALRAFVRLQAGPLLRARESCSDLVQSVCRELLENLEDFEWRGEEKFRHWLYVAALNKIRQHHRYHAAARRDLRREQRLPIASSRDADSGDAHLGELYASLLSPSQQAIGEETAQRLEAAFDALPEHYREVIIACRVLGQSQDEVASRMGRSVDSVRNLLYRALARVAALADPEGEHGDRPDQ